jgi:hypothetical protein
MAKTSDPGDLSSLARRIQETRNARAGAIREVERLDALLDALLATMQTDLNERTNRAAPVASIPNEILSAIFEMFQLCNRSRTVIENITVIESLEFYMTSMVISMS